MRRLDPEKVAAFRHDKGPVGCLLTHGFGGSPFEMRELGEFLSEKGLSVLCRPLPGHGTTPLDMMETDWYDWYRACVANVAELSSRCEKVFLCGMSSGGSLSLHVAAHYAQRYKIAGVAVYATPVYLSNPLLPLLPIVKMFFKFTRPGESDVTDLAARERQQYYNRIPLECIASLARMLAHMENDLQDVTVPVLLIHSKNDKSVDPRNVYLIHKLLGTHDKTVIEVERSGHSLMVDLDKEILKEKTYEFIKRVGNLQ